MEKNRLWATAALIPCFAVLLSGCSLLDPHSNLTIAMVVSEDAWADLPDVTTDPIEITDTACGMAVDCVEAWSTEEADYYRFASRSQAADFAATLDDGFVSHYIAMDLGGKDAAPAVQQQAMAQLANTWQDYEGPYSDRG